MKKNIRLFTKLANVRRVIGDSARKAGVYLFIHEDLSTEATHQLAAVVEFRKKSIIMLGVVCVLSACQKPLLNQNIAAYEKRCIAEGHEKGSPLFSQCVQKYFYVDEDKLNEERYAVDN